MFKSEGRRIATHAREHTGYPEAWAPRRMFRVFCPNKGRPQPRVSSHSNIRDCTAPSTAPSTHGTGHATMRRHRILVARTRMDAIATICMHALHVVCMAGPVGRRQQQRTQTNWLARACESCFAGRECGIASLANSNIDFSGCHWTAMKGYCLACAVLTYALPRASLVVLSRSQW